jgi:protein-tyrosine phosphatase
MDAAAGLAADHGISRVVDVRVEACDDEAILTRHGIQLLHLPTEDTRAVSQRMLRDGARFVSDALDLGERVLVHCQYGIGRSALVALCALVHRGVPPLVALEAAKRARPVISPSPDQLHAFRQFAAWVKAERDCRWEVPTLVQLGEIAWRHLRRGDAGPSVEAARAGSTRGA